MTAQPPPSRWSVRRKKQRIDDLAATAGQTGTIAYADADGGVSLWSSAWRQLRRNPLFLGGLTLVAIFIVVAAFAPLLAPHAPDDRLLIDQVSAASNPIPAVQPGFPLGGDDKGRDLLSRLIYGSRQTLIVGVIATLGGLMGGLILGVLAGGFGGKVDSIVMRLVDVMLSLPSLLLAITIATLTANPSQWTVIIAIAIVQMPIFARLLRGSMLAQRESDYVLAARALGAGPIRLVLRHMLPNSLSPILVQATLAVSVSIIEAASLSFLGLGNPDDRQPEWGQMLGASQKYFDSFPHIAVWPALCIIVVSLGFTLMGESLRAALDPKGKR